jgi:uncharacterized protein YggE
MRRHEIRDTSTRFAAAPVLCSASLASAALFCFFPALFAGRAMCQEAVEKTISVTGLGEVQASPDMATLRVGVVTEAASAGEALSDNNEAVEKLFSTLETSGIEPKDRQTTRFDISPQYRRDRGPRPGNLAQGEPQEPQIIGYQVTNEVSIKVRDLDGLGKLLDAVVDAGANRIQGIQFVIDDQTELVNEVRRQAIEDARNKADVLAAAAGASVGPVISIREHGTTPPPGPRKTLMMAESRSVPIAQGEQTVAERYDVTFRLEASSE